MRRLQALYRNRRRSRAKRQTHPGSRSPEAPRSLRKSADHARAHRRAFRPKRVAPHLAKPRPRQVQTPQIDRSSLRRSSRMPRWWLFPRTETSTLTFEKKSHAPNIPDVLDKRLPGSCAIRIDAAQTGYSTVVSLLQSRAVEGLGRRSLRTQGGAGGPREGGPDGRRTKWGLRLRLCGGDREMRG